MTDELPIVLLHGSATGSYSWAAVRMGVVQGIDYLERNLRRLMRPARRHIVLHMRLGSNRIEYQPLGVVGIISPWNYPVNMSLMPVVTADRRGKPRHAQTIEAHTGDERRARVDVQRAVSRRTGRHGQRRGLRILLPAVRSRRLHREHRCGTSGDESGEREPRPRQP
jgi:hypothetical protein